MLGALLLVRFVDELIAFLPAGTLAAVTGEFHLTYAQAGLLLSIFAAGGLAGSALTVAADHVSRRALAAGGAVAVGLSLLAFGLSPWFAGLLVASVTWGIASDALTGGAETALVDVSGPHLTAALGRQNLLAAAGDLLSPLLLVLAGLARVGWRALFVGASFLLFGYGTWLGLSPLPPPTLDDETSVVGGVMQVLRDPRAWLLALAEAVISIVDEPYLAFMIIFLERSRGVPVALATLVATADLAGSAVGSYFAPRILGGRGSRGLAVCVVGLPLAIIVLITAPSTALQFAAAGAGGLCGAVVWVAVQSATLGLRPGLAGTTSAVVSSIALPAYAFPVLVGAVADGAGLTSAMSLYVGVTLVLVVLLVPLSRLRAGGASRGSGV